MEGKMVKGKALIVSLFFILLISVLLWENPIFAQGSYNEILLQGNRAYDKGDYADAIKSYEEAAKAGIKNPALFYNLGNAYYRKNNLGKAVLYYERALALSPRDRDIRQNLAYVRSILPDQNPAPQGSSFFENIYNFFTLNELCIAFSILYSLVAVFIFLYLRTRKEIYIWLFSILGIFLLFAGVWTGGRIYAAEKVVKAVVISDKAEIRNGPGDNYSVGFVIHEGTTVQALQERSDWSEIAVFGRLKGWVRSGDIEYVSEKR